MNIRETHDTILFLLNESKVGNRTHEEIDRALDTAQMEYFEDLYGDPISRGAFDTWGTTHKIKADLVPFHRRLLLNPFVYSQDNLGGTADGRIVLPSDWIYTRVILKGETYKVKRFEFILEEGVQNIIATTLSSDSVYSFEIDLGDIAGDGYVNYEGQEVIKGGSFTNGQSATDGFIPQTSNGNITAEIFMPTDGRLGKSSLKIYEYERLSSYLPIIEYADDELALALQDSITAPSDDFPAALLDKNEGKAVYELYPRKGIWGEFRYLRRPVKPVYSYTVSGRSEVFDESSSVDMEWNDISMNKIISRALIKLGFVLEDEAAITYAREKITTGG